MKFSQKAAYAIAGILVFANSSAWAGALPCTCQPDHGHLECTCDPGTDGGGGVPCTADPLGCGDRFDHEAFSGVRFQLTVLPPPNANGALCPPDSCNYANGCIDGCSQSPDQSRE